MGLKPVLALELGSLALRLWDHAGNGDGGTAVKISVGVWGRRVGGAATRSPLGTFLL